MVFDGGGGGVESQKNLASTSHLKKIRARTNGEKNIEQDFPVVLIVIFRIKTITVTTSVENNDLSASNGKLSPRTDTKTLSTMLSVILYPISFILYILSFPFRT